MNNICNHFSIYKRRFNLREKSKNPVESMYLLIEYLFVKLMMDDSYKKLMLIDLERFFFVCCLLVSCFVFLANTIHSALLSRNLIFVI